MISLRELLPRIVLFLIFTSGAFFAYFESVYLQDQSAQIGAAKIAFWMWAFRLVTMGLGAGAIIVMITTLRRVLG